MRRRTNVTSEIKDSDQIVFPLCRCWISLRVWGPQLFRVANTKRDEYQSRREEAAHSYSLDDTVANPFIRQSGSPFTERLKASFVSNNSNNSTDSHVGWQSSAGDANPQQVQWCYGVVLDEEQLWRPTVPSLARLPLGHLPPIYSQWQQDTVSINR